MHFQITATRKDGPDSDHRIDAIQLAGGTILSIDEALAWIDQGHTFFVVVGGYRTDVHACWRGYGRRFLHTSPDGYAANNLLNLPDISGFGSAIFAARR